jgi:hypothetical protein
MAGTLIAHAGTELVDREFLKSIPPPKGSYSHKPVPHIEIVEALEQILGTKNFDIRRQDFAVSRDHMRMFGVMDLTTPLTRETAVSIGIRNSNDKSMALGMTAGYRVFVCDNLAFSSDFQPIFAKHTHSISVIDTAILCVERLLESVEPMRIQIKMMEKRILTDREAKEIIYDAFVSKQLGFPQSLFMEIHQFYFSSHIPEFQPRTLWSLSNAFTSGFKRMAPLQMFPNTAKLAEFLKERI